MPSVTRSEWNKQYQSGSYAGVSTRDYAGVIDDLCDGYGIEKSSVSRQWKAASASTKRRIKNSRRFVTGWRR